MYDVSYIFVFNQPLANGPVDRITVDTDITSELTVVRAKLTELNSRIAELEESLAAAQKEQARTQEQNTRLQRDIREVGHQTTERY